MLPVGVAGRQTNSHAVLDSLDIAAETTQQLVHKNRPVIKVVGYEIINIPVSRIEFTANRVCTGQSSDSERARDQWQINALP